MKTSLKILILIAMSIIVTLSFVVLAADKPPAPTLVDNNNNQDLGDYIAYFYTMGQSSCIGIFPKAGGAAPTGACFLEAREILISDPLEVNDKKIYTFTVNLIARPDRDCSILVDSGGATIVCPQVF